MLSYILCQWLDHFPCLKWLFFLMVGWLSQWLDDFPKIEKPFINHGLMPKWCITSCFNGWIIFHVLTDFFPQRLASLVNGWMIFQELKNPLYTLVWCLNDLVQLFSMVGSFSMTKMTHLANGWLAQSMVGWFSKNWKTLYKPWLDAQMMYYIFIQWLDHFPCLKWLFSSMVG